MTLTLTLTLTVTLLMQVIFAEGADVAQAKANASHALTRGTRTKLTQFFTNNLYEWGLRQQESHTTPRPRGYELTYSDYPKFYSWDQKTRSWKRRKRLGRAGRESYIGRMRYVPPTAEAMETFYVRMLLQVVKGPHKFEDLRQVDGVLHRSFKLACFARGLIEDDSEWDHALQEAALSKSARQMRQLFVIILTACFPLDPGKLWQTHCQSMAEDFAYQRDGSGAEVQECDLQKALMDLEHRLEDFPKSRLEDHNLPSAHDVSTSDGEFDDTEQSREVRAETPHAPCCPIPDNTS